MRILRGVVTTKKFAFWEKVVEKWSIPSRHTKRPRRTPRPTRRVRRTPQPTRRPPSAIRRDERDRTNIVRRSSFKTDECDGNVRNLSDKCSELNRLVCSLNRRDLECFIINSWCVFDG